MRYIAEYLEPTTGKSMWGTSGALIRNYASDRNAFRYMHAHLAAGCWPAGQYVVSRWPEHTYGAETVIGHLYKRTTAMDEAKRRHPANLTTTTKGN